MFRSGRSTERRTQVEQTSETLLDRVRRSRDVLANAASLVENKVRNLGSIGKLSKNNPPDEAFIEANRRALKLLETKARAGEMATNLLEIIAEFLDTIDRGLNTARMELRRLSRENRELKASIAYCIEKIYDAESQLASATESGAYWKFMRELLQLDYELSTAGEESELWNAHVPYDKLWDTEYAGFVSHKAQTVFELIDTGNMKDVSKLIDEIPVREAQDKASYATVLQMIARRCYKEEYFKICLDILNKALSIRLSMYGSNHPIISASLNCLALVYSGLGELDKATKIAVDAMAIMERHPEFSKNRALMARQYMQTGQMFIAWNHIPEGIRALQTAVGIWEELLPREEDSWCQALNQMARTCNDNDYHDDAMGLSCDIVDYFHMKFFGSVSDRYPTIYEVAYAHDLAFHDPHSVNLDLYPIGSPIHLSRAQQLALREIAISFACRGELKAAQVIATYLHACTKASATELETAVCLSAHLFSRSDTRSVRFVTPELRRAFRDRDLEKKGLLKILKRFFKAKR
ncbi:unnamed protein product [Echinostoma caproni]|uniref:TPR_REGION domain-containing protein n=1 Tax=Echinostoma caproni TaxID=27848 RepID=A0A183ASJ7_9TREM|nr:unnamed protein product [Echinostoma caproni]